MLIKRNTKKLLVNFYSCRNLGDDLFVYLLSKRFTECKIKLICHPKFFPDLKLKNVSISEFSYLEAIWLKIRKCISRMPACTSFLEKKVYEYRDKLSKKYDAYVTIGGSIFMESSSVPVDFSAGCPPDYTYRSCLQNKGNSFIIGANLGPCGSIEYWDKIKKMFMDKTHVCLRDYASYMKVSDLPHVQYAPDILFMLPDEKIETKNNVVFSVIDIAHHTEDAREINRYYELLSETIQYFTEKNISVTLMSFCKAEGDEKAIEKLLERIQDQALVSVYRYHKDIKEALRVISSSIFVIGTRFHSLILAAVYEIPVFPIVYNCKTKHYLDDLDFAGKYAELGSLQKVECEDILFNYQNNMTPNCSEHKQYAQNQFKGLSDFLNRY